MPSERAEQVISIVVVLILYTAFQGVEWAGHHYRLNLLDSLVEVDGGAK